jgi:hypothetical protein
MKRKRGRRIESAAKKMLYGMFRMKWYVGENDEKN